MALFLRIFSADERADEFMRYLLADYAGPENQHVQMIVLDTVVSRVGVVTESGANPGKSVRDRMPFASLTSHGPLSKTIAAFSASHFQI